jgi:hypothetical protein
LQRVLNACHKQCPGYNDIALDGQLSDETITVLNHYKIPENIIKLLHCLQGVRYIDLLEHDSVHEVHLNGWLNRAAI